MTKAISSMTGFGRSERTGSAAQVRIEIRSVNHRFLDVNLNLPSVVSFKEASLREQIQARLARGRVDVWLQCVELAEPRYRVRVNEALLGDLAAALRSASEKLGIAGQPNLELLTRYPEALAIEAVAGDVDEALSGEVDEVLEEALDALERSRAREGAALLSELNARLEAMDSHLGAVEALASQLVASAYERLKQRLAEILADPAIESDRMNQELALLADKLDVTEETVRLRTHMASMRELLDAGGPVGKQIDFLLQEFGREVNTIGSKARNSELTGSVLAMKAEIEKMREQARNLE